MKLGNSVAFPLLPPLPLGEAGAEREPDPLPEAEGFTLFLDSISLRHPPPMVLDVLPTAIIAQAQDTRESNRVQPGCFPDYSASRRPRVPLRLHSQRSGTRVMPYTTPAVRIFRPHRDDQNDRRQARLANSLRPRIRGSSKPTSLPMPSNARAARYRMGRSRESCRGHSRIPARISDSILERRAWKGSSVLGE